METNNFALYQGKIVYVPDVPIKRTVGGKTFEGITDSGAYQALKKEYDDALQSAIASGIEVENQEEVIHEWRKQEPSCDRYYHLEENKLYTLQCRVEVKEVCDSKDCVVEHSVLHKKVARVTFEQPEKKDSVQWQDIMTTAAGIGEKKDFRTVLKETRIGLTLGQSDFAASLGISAKHLNRIENCIQYPSWPLFFEICSKLSLSFGLKFNLVPEAVGQQEQETQQQLWKDVYFEIDRAARDVDNYDFGLPMFEPNMNTIINSLKESYHLTRKP